MFNYMERRKSGADCIRSSLRGELSNEWQIAWVRLCVCMKGCTNLSQAREKEIPPSRTLLFQFQKEPQNKFAGTERGWGPLNYKVELPGQWKDTSHEGRPSGGEHCELYLLMIVTRLTSERERLQLQKTRAWKKNKKHIVAIAQKRQGATSEGGSLRDFGVKSPGEMLSQGWNFSRLKRKVFSFFFFKFIASSTTDQCPEEPLSALENK